MTYGLGTFPYIVYDWVPTGDPFRSFALSPLGIVVDSCGNPSVIRSKVEDIIDGKHAAAVWLGHNGHTIWLCDGYLPHLYQTTSKQCWLGW
jgi:hypothetical protein